MSRKAVTSWNHINCDVLEEHQRSVIRYTVLTEQSNIDVLVH